MRKIYSKYFPLFVGGLFLILLIASCKKDSTAPPKVTINTGPTPIATLGLYELDSAIYRRLFIPIAKVGTQSINLLSVFDTGSAGMTIDAAGILPASMITNTGIAVSGTSVVVNGITVTDTTSTISYGGGANVTVEYGNLAYAPVTLGDSHGTVATGRIPIFLYYKAVVQNTGQKLPAHSNDVFGVAPGNSYTSNVISSPLSYFKTAANVTSGFKLVKLSNAGFLPAPTYVPGLLQIGLVPNDLTSAGFIMHSLTSTSVAGYSPDIPALITYNGKTIQGTLLFDTGTPAVSIIEDPTARNLGNLPAGTVVSISTASGFSYQYTVGATDNLTQVASTLDPRTIFGIDFFINNEYLTDYTDHQIGLKNN
jgi:hypothetical protein